MQQLGSIARCLLLFLIMPSVSSAMPITFETVPDFIGTGTVVDTQFSGEGVLFFNTLALTAGISLNDIDFPAYSGDTAVRDDGGAMILTFSLPFTTVGGFFTYSTPLTLQAYNSASTLIGQATSAFISNVAGGGGALGSNPNEFLYITTATPIARLVITGAPAGDSFVLDDFNASASAQPVPERSSSALLLLTGLLVCCRKMPTS